MSSARCEVVSAPPASALDFYRLVAEFATRFVNIHADAVNLAIVDSLRQIGEALDIDNCALFLPVDEHRSLRVSHQWGRAGGVEFPTDLQANGNFPSTLSRSRTGQEQWFASLTEVADPIDRASFSALGVRSNASFPVRVNNELHGILAFSSTRFERAWTEGELECLRLAVAVMGQALARKVDQEQLEHAVAETRELRDQLRGENVVLRREVKSLKGSRMIVGESASVRRVLAQVEQVSPTTATVLLLGETGSGKEVFAQHIHDMSPRRGRPMVRVSCAAIPSALIESELFGRERGAYTGALSRQIGRFELANGSTIFLDEIGELAPDIQVKLLRVLQDRVIERLGSASSVKVDVRIIAATNRDLEKAVANGTFREDLYYRLNVFPITVPPLRQHLDDLPALVWSFVDEFSKAFGKNIESISKDSFAALRRYHWPGNVRELRNVVEREMIVATGPHLVINPPRQPQPSSARPTVGAKLVDIEAEHIRSVLENTSWRVRGAGGAAERLGIKPTTLESRMAKLGIVREKSRRPATDPAAARA